MTNKTIQDFNLGFLNIPAGGAIKQYNISGDAGASFDLEIKDSNGKYYNFATKTFQANEVKLSNKIIGPNGTHKGSITFPKITSTTDYDFYLLANPGTQHAPYKEIRRADNSIDLNASRGSDSLILRKIAYQYPDLTITISPYSPNSVANIIHPGSKVDATITVPVGSGIKNLPFEIKCTTVNTTNSYNIKRQPLSSDFLSFVEPTVGASTEALPGEDIYGGVARSSNRVVNGAVTSGTNVTMDDDVGSLWAIGDRITGNAALDAKVGSGAVTVTAVNVGSNAKVFTMSEAIAIDDDETLTFTEPRYRSWPVDSVFGISENMIVVPATNVVAGTTTSRYEDSITVGEGTDRQEKIVSYKTSAIDTKGSKPTVTREKITAQAGNIVFSKPQPLALAGDGLKIGGYGVGKIHDIHGYRVKFSDLKVELTKITTTTTEASAGGSSADIAVADREGIVNNVSRVSGIGINSALQSPLITSGGGADGAGDWTFNAAQTLENGITLTIENTGRTATITGNIEILETGTANATLRLDIEDILSVT